MAAAGEAASSESISSKVSSSLDAEKFAAEALSRAIASSGPRPDFPPFSKQPTLFTREPSPEDPDYETHKQAVLKSIADNLKARGLTVEQLATYVSRPVTEEDVIAAVKSGNIPLLIEQEGDFRRQSRLDSFYYLLIHNGDYKILREFFTRYSSAFPTLLFLRKFTQLDLIYRIIETGGSGLVLHEFISKIPFVQEKDPCFNFIARSIAVRNENAFSYFGGRLIEVGGMDEGTLSQLVFLMKDSEFAVVAFPFILKWFKNKEEPGLHLSDLLATSIYHRSEIFLQMIADYVDEDLDIDTELTFSWTRSCSKQLFSLLGCFEYKGKVHEEVFNTFQVICKRHLAFSLPLHKIETMVELLSEEGSKKALEALETFGLETKDYFDERIAEIVEKLEELKKDFST